MLMGMGVGTTKYTWGLPVSCPTQAGVLSQSQILVLVLQELMQVQDSFKLWDVHL